MEYFAGIVSATDFAELRCDTGICVDGNPASSMRSIINCMSVRSVRTAVATLLGISRCGFGAEGSRHGAAGRHLSVFYRTFLVVLGGLARGVMGDTAPADTVRSRPGA
jgi:hypothetical protein